MINIIGAGIAGLIMGNYLLTKGKPFRIIEQNKREDMYNHSAPFFLHSDSLAEIMPLEKIRVHFNLWSEGGFVNQPTVRQANEYSKTITGGLITETSIWFIGEMDGWLPATTGSGIEPATMMMNLLLERIEQHVEFERTIIKINTDENKIDFNGTFYYTPYSSIINTAPLPILLGWIGHKAKMKYESIPIYIITTGVPNSLGTWQVVYVVDEKCPFYRACLFDGKLFIEMKKESELKLLAEEQDVARWIKKIFGIDWTGNFKFGINQQGRFVPIKHHDRKVLMRQLTDAYNIYSIGRYATWSYKRTDHLLEDARKITETINYKSGEQSWL